MPLSTALRANALFTGACGLACFVANARLAAHIPLSLGWLKLLGGLFLTYVPMLLFAGARPGAWLVKTIIAFDWGYVALATGFTLLALGRFDAAGLILVLATTGLVALFAVLQQQALAQREAAR